MTTCIEEPKVIESILANIVEREKKQNQFRIKQEVVVEIEGENKPTLIAEWLTMTITA